MQRSQESLASIRGNFTLLMTLVVKYGTKQSYGLRMPEPCVAQAVHAMAPKFRFALDPI